MNEIEQMLHDKIEEFKYEPVKGMQSIRESIPIGVRIKRLRAGKFLKLREVSEFTGLSISHISDIERLKTRPSLKTCARLAYFYGISLSEMFDDVTVGFLEEGE